MDESTKKNGRSQIYTGGTDSRVQRIEARRRAKQTAAQTEHVSAQEGQTAAQTKYTSVQEEQIAAQAEHISAQEGQTAARAEHTSVQEERTAAQTEHIPAREEQTAGRAENISALREQTAGRAEHASVPGERSAGKGKDAARKGQPPAGVGEQLRSRVSERLNPATKRKREQENLMKMQMLGGILGILILLLIAAILYEVVLGHGIRETGNERMARREADAQQENRQQDRKNGSGGTPADPSGQTAEGESEVQGNAVPASELLEQARRKAAQYDYDGAAALLKSADDYESNGAFQAAVGEFEQQKAACVPYSASDVTHIFFHTLIHDPARAFDGDEYENGYNQYMVTEHEFNSIIQQMYDRGYVMVFLDEIVSKTEDSNGNTVFATHDILLPPDRIPFVLSQDDVSYYHYMDGDGFASRLIVDENGDVKNEYIEDDGSVSVGDYDMVPLLDRFVEQHPDFSYHGEKGYIALTGYEGILGYRTDEVYRTKEAGRITYFQQAFFDSYPGGFDEAAFERECEGAKKVAEAMKANGWKFASHTWGHQNMNETNGISYDAFVRDTDRWETWVEPLIGETDTLIYAFGGDIRGAEPYSGERFNYLKQNGFDYFCGVDSAKHWLQVGTDYVRQSRRNIDGYRMFYNPEMLNDLFDVSQAWDPLRPASVPPI